MKKMRAGGGDRCRRKGVGRCPRSRAANSLCLQPAQVLLLPPANCPSGLRGRTGQNRDRRRRAGRRIGREQAQSGRREPRRDAHRAQGQVHDLLLFEPLYRRLSLVQIDHARLRGREEARHQCRHGYGDRDRHNGQDRDARARLGAAQLRSGSSSRRASISSSRRSKAIRRMPPS